MPDVSVNIRGRDDGLGNLLDNLRDKANEFGRDVGNLNNFENLTKTEKKVEITNVNDDVTQSRKQSTIDEFNELRQANLREFNQQTQDYVNGKVSEKDYNSNLDRFNQSNQEIDVDEKSELTEIEKESRNFLKEILRQLQIQEQIEREKRQLDGEEYDEGTIGFLLQQNNDLRSQQKGSSDQDEINDLQAQINANNAAMKGMKNGGREVDDSNGGDNDGRFAAGFRSAAGAAARGDLSGTVGGGIQMAHGAGKIGSNLMIAGIIAMVIKEFFASGEKVQEALGQVSAMRGGSGNTAINNNRAFQKEIADIDIFDELGLTEDAFAAMVNQKAMASGIGGGNAVGRTLDDYAFQKGFGADVGQFSQFERFTKNQETATTIGLDVLNVLTSINKSSLKEGDLSTLAEKLGSQNAILSLQRSKRDVVDNDSALRVLAAFEKAGLSAKGEHGADFLTQTIQGLGEGGGDNQMLFKYEAAKRARPDLAGDPAALRRFVRFNSDDPKYQAEFFKFAKRASGGSQMAMDDILYSMFDPKSEKDMDIYGDLMNNSDGAMDMLSGKTSPDKRQKATLTKDQMYQDATNDTGAVQQTMKDFSNAMQDLLIEMKSFGTKWDKGVKVINWPNWASSNKTKTGK